MSRLFAVLGPTASGKTDLAIALAERIRGEIISVDSMQVYRGMDVGTAKPTIVERRGVPHHMIDVVEPDEEFTVAEFRRAGRAVIESSDKPLVISGGSGLHFRALVDPMSFAPTEPTLRAELERTDIGDLVAELLDADSDAAHHVDLANHRRVVRAVEIYRLSAETPSQRATAAEAERLRRYVPEVEFRAVGVDPGELMTDRIDRRLTAMKEGGLLEEVMRLRGQLGRTAGSAVGYRELLAHLDGEVPLDEAYEAVARNTRKLAKKQRTWFQRDPRIHWIPWIEDADERVERAVEVLK